MAAALVGPIVNALMPLLTQEALYLLDVERELSKLKETLSTILAVLEDAERRQFKDKAVGDWLHKLKDAAYDAQAIVDECEISGLRLGHEGMSGSVGVWSRKFLNCFRFLHVKARRKMGRKIKRFRERLDEIDADKRQFHLSAGAIKPGGQGENDGRTPSISLSEPKVYGREGDVENIVKLLLHDDDGIIAIPVLGMGGLGKTTLVQLVYNDARVETHFKIRVWVCVSEEFKLKRLVRAIIESATGEVCGLTELDPLQRCLREILEGKNFLLVLDDVWHNQESVWEPLKQILMRGAQGSAVIVTTRMEKVASMMGSIDQAPYRLGLLDNVSCSALFEWKAFGDGRREKKQSLVQIGIEIVCKCKGIPLAAKALGSLLYFKNEEREWLLIRDSEIWELPEEQNNILPILRLSYDHMPSQLKQCFAFCSIFPKDTVIEKKMLTRIWVANGFICSRGSMELEDVGHEIFDELIWRTMFQDVKLNEFGNTLSCKMHDLMHDLAQSVMLYECMIMVGGRRQHCTSNSTRHLQFCDYKSMSTTDHVNVNKVRTIMFNSTDRQRIEGVIKYVKDFKQLRVLDLSNVVEENLHPSIGKLKHLRYFDISGWLVKAIPDSITNLQFLQSLILKHCKELCHLPKGLPNVSSLHHLDLSGCNRLQSLPSNIGNLSLLQTLPIYILGENGEPGLDQLQNLNLRGELAVKHLERVTSCSFESGTKFISGQIIDTLKLSWRRISTTTLGDHEQANSDNEILESLQPHSCLKKLEIDGYGGSTFPLWLMQTSNMLSCLVSVFLNNCFKCQILPTLGQLPSLKQLDILKMDAVKCIGSEFYGDLHTSFPSLEKLIIGYMPNLETWSVGEHVGALLNQLLRLTLIMLPMLVNFPRGLLRNCCNLQYLVLQSCFFKTLEAELDSLVMMKRLQIIECNELSSLPYGLRNLSALEELEIVKCNKLKSLASEDVLLGLASLKTLSIKKCNLLTGLTENISPLLALNHLEISDCVNLVALPQGMESLSSLKSLVIFGCEKVGSLPEVVTTLEKLQVSCKLILAASTEWVQRLTSLTWLFLYECRSVLLYLPPWLMQLTALQKLHIYGASPELVARCKELNGEDRHMIAHLPEENVCFFSS